MHLASSLRSCSLKAIELVRSQPMEFVLTTVSQRDQRSIGRSTDRLVSTEDLRQIDARNPDTYDFVLHDGSDHFL